MWSGLIRRVAKTALLAACPICLCISDAQAGQFYVETNGGLAKMSEASPFFGPTASPGFGSTFMVGFGLNLGAQKAYNQIHINLQARLTSASDNATYYGLLTPYAVVRYHVGEFMLGAGATPFVWRRIAESAGFSGWERPASSMGFLGELGYELPITPEVSVFFEGAGEVIRAEGSLSPKPVFEGLVGFRFYLYLKGSNFEDSSTNSDPSLSERPFWRYPYGRELN
jgi:hypothetical protein